MKNYTYVDIYNGTVKACTEEEALDLCNCKDFFVITPEGNWLSDGEWIEVER